MKSRSGFPGKISFSPSDENHHQRFARQFFHPLYGSCFTFESNETIKDVMLKSGMDSMRVRPSFIQSFPENPFQPSTTPTTTTTTTTEPTTTKLATTTEAAIADFGLGGGIQISGM